MVFITRFQHPAWSQAHVYCLAMTTGRNGIPDNRSRCGPHQGLLMCSGFLLLLPQVTTDLVPEIRSLTVLVSNQAGSVSLGGLQSVDRLSVSLLDTDRRNCLLFYFSFLNSLTFLGPWSFLCLPASEMLGGTLKLSLLPPLPRFPFSASLGFFTKLSRTI